MASAVTRVSFHPGSDGGGNFLHRRQDRTHRLTAEHGIDEKLPSLMRKTWQSAPEFIIQALVPRITKVFARRPRAEHLTVGRNSRPKVRVRKVGRSQDVAQAPLQAAAYKDGEEIQKSDWFWQLRRFHRRGELRRADIGAPPMEDRVR